MWEFIRTNQLVTVLTGGVASTLLALLIGHFRRERNELGIAVQSEKVQEPVNTDLKFKQVDCHVVSICNIGNRALKDLPIAVVCLGEIVSHEFTVPDGFKLETGFVGDGELRIVPELLNPDEAIVLRIVVGGANSTNVEVRARAAGLKVKKVSGWQSKPITRSTEFKSLFILFSWICRRTETGQAITCTQVCGAVPM